MKSFKQPSLNRRRLLQAGAGLLGAASLGLAMPRIVRAQANQAAQLTEIRKNLKGVVPQNPLQSINPENWFFTQ